MEGSIFEQGNEEVRCTVISISTGLELYGLIDSTFVITSGKNIICLDSEKRDELWDIIDDSLPSDSDWDNGYDYEFNFEI